MRLATMFVLLGCGGDPGSSSVDAAVQADATTDKVVALSSCPSSVAAEIMDSDTSFVPAMTTISVNQVVKIVMTAEHTVIPNTLTTTDPVLMVGRGQTKCFRFLVPGTYGFACGVHGFAGTITVQ